MYKWTPSRDLAETAGFLPLWNSTDSGSSQASPLDQEETRTKLLPRRPLALRQRWNRLWGTEDTLLRAVEGRSLPLSKEIGTFVRWLLIRRAANPVVVRESEYLPGPEYWPFCSPPGPRNRP